MRAVADVGRADREDTMGVDSHCGASTLSNIFEDLRQGGGHVDVYRSERFGIAHDDELRTTLLAEHVDHSQQIGIEDFKRNDRSPRRLAGLCIVCIERAKTLSEATSR